MNTYFSISNNDILRLSQSEAVARFRDLLYADGLRLGIASTKIHVSDLINVADGGIDASVEDVPETSGSKFEGAFRPQRTGYQIKTGGSFKPWTVSAIEGELFNKDGTLAEGIKNLLDAKGTYVLVCFGHDLVEKDHQNALKLLKDQFKSAGYPNAKVEVWSQHNLRALFERYPSLALRINGRDNPPLVQSHSNWSLNDDMTREFVSGDAQNDFIKSLQDAMRSTGNAVSVRVLGEPGIGKTKLVFESTRAIDLTSHVLYFGSPSSFRESSLVSSILASDNSVSAILVVDECPPSDATFLWNILKNRGDQIKLITIYNDYDDTLHEIILDAPPLSNEEIVKIIVSYGVPEVEAYAFADFCSGAPRVAHVLGANLRCNPEDLLSPTATVSNLWERYIVGNDIKDSQGVRDRYLVLRHVALFKRFGYGQIFAEDSEIILALIREVDPNLTKGRFAEIIHSLRKRKILQGDNILYITPKALHLKLWAEWWDIYGSDFDLDGFSAKLNPQLAGWLKDMFRYAGGSAMAQKVVKRLLGTNGPFRGNLLETREGADFFQVLADADPEDALICLKHYINKQSKEDLVSQTSGRRGIVHALEHIAKWESMFVDAANLLLRLGEAENETWSNNASGVFADLFTLGYGPVASTSAPPNVRYPVLRAAFDSGARERQSLAIKAIDHALESRHFSRAISSSHQSLKPGPDLWMPSTYGEIWEGYRQAWQLLDEYLAKLPSDLQLEASKVLLDRSAEMLHIPDLADTVIETITSIATNNWTSKEAIILSLTHILRWGKEHLDKELLQKIESLKDNITGNDFESLLRRHVAMNIHEDNFDQEGNYVGLARNAIEQLAQQSIDNIDLLRKHLAWLVLLDSINAQIFGYEIGKRDNEGDVLALLLQAQEDAAENGSPYLLAGYLSSLFEKDPLLWEATLDKVADNSKIHKLIPMLTARSGGSESAVSRIISLIESERLDESSLSSLSYWGFLPKLSTHSFHRLVGLLLKKQNDALTSTALDLFTSYYTTKNEAGQTRVLPKQLTYTLLRRSLVWSHGVEYSLSSRSDHIHYNWVLLAINFLKSYPDRALALADIMLASLRRVKGYVDTHQRPMEVLGFIFRKHPSDMWLRVSKILAMPRSILNYTIQNWLKGGLLWEDDEEEGKLEDAKDDSEDPEDKPASEGTRVEPFLGLVPIDLLWAWVDQDIENRAWRLAVLVPKALFHEKNRLCLARELLARYGDRDDVRRNLSANFSTGGWMGSASLHWARKRDHLLAFRINESNERVLNWIDEYVAYLNTLIDEERIREEYERLA